jgi:hypothetical protein
MGVSTPADGPNQNYTVERLAPASAVRATSFSCIIPIVDI